MIRDEVEKRESQEAEVAQEGEAHLHPRSRSRKAKSDTRQVSALPHKDESILTAPGEPASTPAGTADPSCPQHHSGQC